MVRWLAWDRVALRPRRSPVATSHGRRSGCDPRWTPHGHCHWSVTRVVAGSRQRCRCRCAPALSGCHLRILAIAIGAHLHPSELDRHSASDFYSHCVFLSCFSITLNYSLPHAHPATSSLLTRTAPSASSSFTCISSSLTRISSTRPHCTYLPLIVIVIVPTLLLLPP
ncbi:hypothetical protein C8R43DRAFT_528507 [Mycena crocata]|nr:hypothetical protein C8R43DRAFT_528507 [Mycena crocata]